MHSSDLNLHLGQAQPESSVLITWSSTAFRKSLNIGGLEFFSSRLLTDHLQMIKRIDFFPETHQFTS